jgi:hypothetical protein
MKEPGSFNKVKTFSGKGENEDHKDSRFRDGDNSFLGGQDLEEFLKSTITH